MHFYKQISHPKIFPTFFIDGKKKDKKFCNIELQVFELLAEFSWRLNFATSSMPQGRFCFRSSGLLKRSLYLLRNWFRTCKISMKHSLGTHYAGWNLKLCDPNIIHRFLLTLNTDFVLAARKKVTHTWNIGKVIPLGCINLTQNSFRLCWEHEIHFKWHKSSCHFKISNLSTQFICTKSKKFQMTCKFLNKP